MSKATRKPITPGVLATALGVVAALALMAAVVWLPGAAQAQSGPQNPFSPAAPTGVTATVDSATQITVTWTAGSGGGAVTGYEVERKVGSGAYTGVTPAHAGTAPTYIDTNVTSGTSYTYRVRANGSGAQNSAWVASNAVTVSAAIPQLDPPVVTVQANADRQLTVSWDAVMGASGYMVSWSPASENGTSSHSLGSGATSYTITDLQPATAYSVEVIALGTAGQSANSEPGMASGMTNPVAYDLLLSHGPADQVNTCPVRTQGRDQCVGASEFNGGDFAEDDATLNGEPDRIDTATIRTDTRQVVLHAEVKTDSPEDTTTVTIRIENGSGTDGLDDNPGIVYSTSGLNAPGVRSIEDGTLDIQIRDEASRVFDVYVDCRSMMEDLSDLTGTLDLEVRDADQRLVAQATIMCAPPVVPPTPEITVDGCFVITGMADRSETVAGLSINDPIELLTSDPSVAITVTSRSKSFEVTQTGQEVEVEETECLGWDMGAMYIRLVDELGTERPNVDDKGGFVDTNGFLDEHGEVVGLDSHGRLELDIETDDITVDLGDGETRTYSTRAGIFRVFTPDAAVVGSQYYVEAYDEIHVIRRVHGLVQYVSDPSNTAPTRVGSIAAVEMTVGQTTTAMDVSRYFADADMGDTLTYMAMSSMPSYATAMIPEGSSMLTITGVAAGSATITVTATDPDGAYAMQTIMVTVTAAELGAPTNVTAMIDETDPGLDDIVVTWMDGANADVHHVYLVPTDFDFSNIRNERITSGMTHTFMDVAPDTYIVAVQSTSPTTPGYEYAIAPGTITVGGSQ